MKIDDDIKALVEQMTDEERAQVVRAHYAICDQVNRALDDAPFGSCMTVLAEAFAKTVWEFKQTNRLEGLLEHFCDAVRGFLELQKENRRRDLH